MKIQVIGFGVIGQGFVDVLLRKEKFLKQRYDLDLRVVSISDITGTAVEGDGIDLRRALEVMRQTRGIVNYPGARKMTGVEAIEAFEADAVLEVTPPTSRPASPDSPIC